MSVWFPPFALLRHLLAVYAPRTCASCDATVPENHVFCTGCVVTIERLSTEPDADVHAPYVHGGAMALAVQRLKYEGRGDLGAPLGELLAASVGTFTGGRERTGRLHMGPAVSRDAATRIFAGGRERTGPVLASLGADQEIDFVVPIPSTPARLAERGRNPAAQLARPIAERLGKPMIVDALVRTETARQATRSGQERRLGMVGVFRASTRKVQNARILLVDDVVTTGATLTAATEALYAGGACMVHACALTRAI
jgi:predicted amidophosphoribosyltransferase